jgi:mono/diheme cytochrome c family protein
MRRALALAALLGLGLLGGCERFFRDMYEQPRYDPGEGSPLFANGKASRTPPPESVPYSMGDPAAISSGRRGWQAVAERQAASLAETPPPVDRALLLRGRERYEIYCLPCHSPLGDGDGPIVRHGFPAPPSYHEPRLRAAPDRHFYDVITRGYGVMYAYGDRVEPADRWAIVAYIRALQLSQHAPIGALTPELQASLRALPAAGATESTLPAPRATESTVPAPGAASSASPAAPARPASGTAAGREGR